VISKRKGESALGRKEEKSFMSPIFAWPRVDRWRIFLSSPQDLFPDQSPKREKEKKIPILREEGRGKTFA